MYAVFVAVIVMVVLAADWGRLQRVFFQWDIARDQLPEIITIAARNTVLFTLIAFGGGLAFGVLLALMKLSTVAPYRWVATAYVEIFRGLPALLTIFAMAYAVPVAFSFRPPGGAVGAGLIALIMVAAAYVAEIVRAGIQGVPKGQAEAARSLGMSPNRTMFSIILPQAFRIVIPPITNEFVLLIKDTSLLFIVGTTPAMKELTTYSRDAMNTAGNATPLVMGGLLYLMITIPLTRLVAVLEKRQARSR
ncbi:amino acid ABC transporter permease [Phytoactinopolyspora limicola]|uniref:amino acid ABC transporter permease n=1 Tax=Phytoactinopolyspora limicola TaxID=2715536 RepID=UPI00140AA38C|nr:amino acid ABC transporter permease [Phytoactinopolyspora limicola]